MSSLQTLVAIFTATPTLANAKKVVAKHIHHPMAICLLLGEDVAQVRNAERLVASVTPLAAATTCKLAEAADKLS